MLDHDKAIEIAWEKAERIEKEMEVKKSKKRRLFTAMSIFVVACVLGLIGWKGVNKLKPGKNTTNDSRQPTGTELNSMQYQPTSIPGGLPGTVEIARPTNIFVVDKSEVVSPEEIKADPGDIVIGSQTLKKVLDEAGEEGVYYPVEIRFCLQTEATRDFWNAVVESEVFRIRNQGIFVERVHEDGVDILISKNQLDGLLPSDVCGYILGWTK